MPHLPAFCDSCDTIFNSGIFVTNSSEIGVVDCKSGPCPSCGGMGHIPDGIYNIIDNAIQVLTAPQRTIDELRRFAALIKSAKENKLSSKELSDNLAQELPELSSLSDIWPKTRNELYQIILIIIALINMLLLSANHYLGREDRLPKNEIEHLINGAIEKSYQKLDDKIKLLKQEVSQKKKNWKK